MYARILNFILILLLMVVVISCDSVKSKGGDAEINIRIYEELPSRNLQMHLSTVKIYNQSGHQIDVIWHKAPMGFDFTFKGVLKHGRMDAFGPATATIDLGVLNTGTYRLIFRKGQNIHLGKLDVFNDQYTINFNSNPVFNFLNSPLNRIPDHTIWGLVGYHREETKPLVQSFFSELIELGAIMKPFAPGNYNSFEIDKNGDVVNYNAGYRFSQAFVFYYSEDTSELDNFLKQWSYLHSELMSISIYTDKGEAFLSWMY